MTRSTEPFYQRGSDCWGVALQGVGAAWQMLDPPPFGAFLALVLDEPAANANSPSRPTAAPPRGW